MAKIKQSETVFIKRSQVNFAAYNPRKANPKVVDALKKNFKKVGFMGGIQWNETTGNLIGGHKRTEALDLIHGYDGTEATDYEIKVEKIQLTEKQEKEQNIFLNNKRVQGETDFKLMAELIEEIDIDAAGLEEYDIEYIETLVPDFKFGKNDDIVQDLNAFKDESNSGKDYVKGVKEKIKGDISNTTHRASYIVITFQDYDQKAEFLSGIGINEDDIYITSDKFFKRLNE
jgi:hypothetical protein